MSVVSFALAVVFIIKLFFIDKIKDLGIGYIILLFHLLHPSPDPHFKLLIGHM